MVTLGLIIAGLLIAGALILAFVMLGALWFGTNAASPPDEPGSRDPGPPEVPG